MSSRVKSRRAFLLASAAGLPAAWVAANYPGILAAQQRVRLAAKAGQRPRPENCQRSRNRQQKHTGFNLQLPHWIGILTQNRLRFSPLLIFVAAR